MTSSESSTDFDLYDSECEEFEILMSDSDEDEDLVYIALSDADKEYDIETCVGSDDLSDNSHREESIMSGDNDTFEELMDSFELLIIKEPATESSKLET